MSDTDQQQPETKQVQSKVCIATVHPTTYINYALFNGIPMLTIAPKKAEELQPEETWLGIQPIDAATAVRLSEMFATIARYYNNTPAVEVPAIVDTPPETKPKRRRKKEQLQ